MAQVAARFRDVFRRGCGSVIGMVHVAALPGAPRHQSAMRDIIQTACREAAIYSDAGVDGVLVENMHDVPYLNRSVGPETTAAMAVVCKAVREQVPSSIPCGIQILAGANREALGVAKVCGLQFIRAEGFVFGHVADEGFMSSDAGELLRYRRSIGAEDVLVFTDIKKKHSSHAITSDVSLGEVAQAAEFFCSDGLVITGSATGHAAKPKHIKEVQQSSQLPVLVGSGVTTDNLEMFLSADALIIGSHFKQNGDWKHDVDRERVKMFMKAVHKLRQ